MEPLLYLIGVVVKSTVILLVAAGLVALLRGAPAYLRARLWTVSFAGIVALPFLVIALPTWDVLPSSLSTSPALEEWVTRGASPVVTAPAPATPSRPSVGAEEGATGEVAGGASASEEGEGAPLTSSREGGAPVGLWYIWAAGAGGVLLWIGWGFLSLSRLRRSTRVVRDPRIRHELETLARQVGVGPSTIDLLASREVSVPATWGGRRRTILLPDSIARGPEELRRTVLLHELLHIRRRDWTVRLLILGSCTMYWFNPLVWIARRWCLSEQEGAVDESVVALGVSPSDYAARLLHVMRLKEVPHGPHPVTAGALWGSSFEKRIRSILRLREALRPPSRWARIGSTVIVTVSVLATAAMDVAPRDLPDYGRPLELREAGAFDGTNLPGAEPFREVLDAGVLGDGSIAVLEGAPRWRILTLASDGTPLYSRSLDPWTRDAVVPHGPDGLAVAERDAGRLHIHQVVGEDRVAVDAVEVGFPFRDACWMGDAFFLVDDSGAAGRGEASDIIRVVNETGDSIGSLAPGSQALEVPTPVGRRNVLIACLRSSALVLLADTYSGQVSAWSRDGERRWTTRLPGYRAMHVTNEPGQVRFALPEGENAWDRVVAVTVAGERHALVQVERQWKTRDGEPEKRPERSIFAVEAETGRATAISQQPVDLVGGSEIGMVVGRSRSDRPVAAAVNLFDVIRR